MITLTDSRLILEIVFHNKMAEEVFRLVDMLDPDDPNLAEDPADVICAWYMGQLDPKDYEVTKLELKND